jgi:hypothetical protein
MFFRFFHLGIERKFWGKQEQILLIYTLFAVICPFCEVRTILRLHTLSFRYPFSDEGFEALARAFAGNDFTGTVVDALNNLFSNEEAVKEV